MMAILENNQAKKISLKLEAGVTVRASVGLTADGVTNHMSTRRFYLADKGSRLELLDKKYYFNVATYTLSYPDRYLHTYDYAPEQSWTTYAGDLSGQTYRQNVYVFQERRYFRVCLKRLDEGPITEEEAVRADQILRFISTAELMPTIFFDEVMATADQVNALLAPGKLAFAVLTDTHATINGIWPDTIANLSAVADRVPLDGIIHLGDLTDGIVPRHLTEYYSRKMIQQMKAVGIPVDVVLGNHDANYFHGNPETLTLAEQAGLYQADAMRCKAIPEVPFYYKDYTTARVRCIFLSAYDNRETVRYGYDDAQLAWLAEVLRGTPLDYKILLFSHDAPVAELDFWSSSMRGSIRLMELLETRAVEKHDILGFIHGHTHADSIHQEYAFPIISIGCAKCEDMPEKKPQGSYTAKRGIGIFTQELWDILVIEPEQMQLSFIRFGAGKDRSIRANLSSRAR